MTGTAAEGFGAHPFAEIARATLAAQERSLELALGWSESLPELPLAPVGTQPEAFGNLVQSWNEAFLRLLEAAPGPAGPLSRPG
jgi:hypothetical protein